MAFRRALFSAAALSSVGLALKEALPDSVTGATALLSEEGLQQVADLRDATEMAKFVRRVVDKEGMIVTSEPHLNGMTLYYSGHCATQTFDALVKEIHRGQTTINKCSKAWVAPKNGTASQSANYLRKAKKAHSPFFSWLLGSIFGAETAIVAEVDTTQESVVVDGMHIGVFASLDNRGYQAVAATRNKAEMAMFVHRFLKEKRLRVLDEGALQALLPYYDGECGAQTFAKLTEEMENGVIRSKECFGGPWLEFEK